MVQQSLFETEPQEFNFDPEHLHVSKSTFLGGLGERVHRWFTLTPSFGPGLVRHILKDMDTPASASVLDPFAGAGTTLIESKLIGHAAYGFEINPFLHWVCRASLCWDLDGSRLEEVLGQIELKFNKDKDSTQSITELGLKIPPIHNVHRWWREDVLADLLILRRAIMEAGAKPTERDFFNLALAGVLVPNLTNVTLGRLQLHFINKENYRIAVWEQFSSHARTMMADVLELQSAGPYRPAHVIHTDSTKLAGVDGMPRFDRVVTSPPYPNRYSYVWNTRPHLYLFEFIREGREASSLDLHTIGGTWGTATSALMKGIVEPAFPEVEQAVGGLAKRIRNRDNLMANYLMKYFNLLSAQIRAQHSYLTPDAKLAYVVGCSRLREEYVETDVLLARIFEKSGLGYRVTGIKRFRRRHSGKDLHESVVYVDRTA